MTHFLYPNRFPAVCLAPANGGPFDFLSPNISGGVNLLVSCSITPSAATATHSKPGPISNIYVLNAGEGFFPTASISPISHERASTRAAFAGLGHVLYHKSGGGGALKRGDQVEAIASGFPARSIICYREKRPRGACARMPAKTISWLGFFFRFSLVGTLKKRFLSRADRFSPSLSRSGLAMRGGGESGGVRNWTRRKVGKTFDVWLAKWAERAKSLKKLPMPNFSGGMAPEEYVKPINHR